MSTPRKATVEDCDSDSNETLSDRLKTTPSKSRRKPATANAPASDSGYSSHAAGGVTSPAGYDTAEGVDEPPTGARQGHGGATPSRRRPSVSASRASGHERPHVVRAATSSDPRTRGDGGVPCACAKCAPRRRSMATPLETPWNLDYPPFDSNTMYVEVPTATAAGRRYMTETPLVYPQRPRPQLYRSSRPVSYHGGAAAGSYQEEGYFADSYGPPPAMSAYSNSPMSTISPSYPQRGPYVPAASLPATPQNRIEPLAYDASRPVAPRRATDNYASSRPVSMYGAPVIRYDQPPQSAPPYGSHRHRRTADDFPRSMSREEEASYRMPPPPLKPSRQASVHQQPSRERSRREIPRSASTRPAEAEPPVLSEPAPRARSRRPSLSRGERQYKTYADGMASVQVEAGSSRRRTTYSGQEKTRHQERSAEEYQDATRSAPAGATLTADALQNQRRRRRAGSSSGSVSRAGSSRDGSEVKSRSSSGIALNIPESDQGLTMRFSAGGAGLKLDFSDGFDGRTISVKPGLAGHELSIGSRKTYVDRSGAELEYARTEPRRGLEEARSSRHSRSSSHSRHSRASSYQQPPSYQQPFF
ncbi:MAG: hypothetical protein M1832_002665 [Thelocarpon impressellum]|nr:MAG: hypothetical protein M1832_002665 [Thelocarpon impressellum]